MRCVVWTWSGVYTQIGPGWAQTSEMLLSLLSPPVTQLSVSGQFLSWNRINHSSETEELRKSSQDCAIQKVILSYFIEVRKTLLVLIIFLKIM